MRNSLLFVALFVVISHHSEKSYARNEFDAADAEYLRGLSKSDTNPGKNFELKKSPTANEVFDFLQAKKDADTLAKELQREKETSARLLRENVLLKSNTSILNERVANLQNALRRTNDERRKTEQDNAELFYEMVNIVEKLNTRIEELEEEVRAAADDNKQTQQQQQQETGLTTIETYNGMILSGEDSNVQMYSLETGQLIYSFDGVAGVTGIELISSDLLLTSSSDYSINLWSLTRDDLIDSLVGHTGLVVSFALLSANLLASGSTDSEIRVWNIESRKCLRTLIHSADGGDTYEYAVFAIQPLANRRLASGSECGSIKIWNMANGACLKELNTSPQDRIRVHSLALLANKRLASGRGDFTIQIWDLLNYVCLTTLRGHSGAVYALLALPGSNVLVSASADKTIKKWDLTPDTCQETNVRTLSGHSDQVFSLALVSNKTIASASFDNTIRLWDMHSGRSTLTIYQPSFANPAPFRFSTNCLKFSLLQL